MLNILDKIQILVVSTSFHAPVTLTPPPLLKKTWKNSTRHIFINIASSGSSEGTEIIKSMRFLFLFCISDDIVTLAGCVIINIMSCYLNYLLDLFDLKIKIFGESL